VKRLVAAAAIGVGLLLGWMNGARTAGGAEPSRLVQKSQAQMNQEILQAVRNLLAGAKVPPQDMPKAIIKVEAMGGNRYRAHLQMVQGEGWFEATWDGSRWHVTGINPPL
jgi:hypothetical protein